jgi:type II secretory pathway pseudopilin PulG
MWWTLGEVVGTPLLQALGLAGLYPMIFSGWRRNLALGLLGAQTAAMCLAQAFLPGLPPRLGQAEILVDATVSALLLGTGLALLVALVVLSQRREQERVEAARRRLAEANAALEERNQELDAALKEIRTLQGIIPICSSCKKVRNDEGFYEAVEGYISRHSTARFSHTLCPDCLRRHYPEYAEGPGPDPS